MHLHGTRSATIAHLLAQAGGIAGQLLAIPVYLSAWGAEVFGAWGIFLSASVLASVMDIGLSQAVVNRLLQAQARREHGQAKAWQGLALKITFLTLLGGAGLLFVLRNLIAEHLAFMPRSVDVPLLTATFGIYIVLCATSSQLFALLRVVHNGLGSWLSTWAIWLDLCAPLFLAWTGASPEMASFALLLSRGIQTLLAIVILSAKRQHVCNLLVASERVQLRDIIRPAVGNLLYPAAVLLQLQGTTFLLGKNIDLISAASYALCRTVSRVPFQLAYAGLRARLPDISRELASKREGGNSAANAWTLFWRICPVLIGAFIICQTSFQAVWSHNKLNVEFATVLLVGFATLLHGYWNFGISMLMAANMHLRLSLIVLSIFAISLALCAELKSFSQMLSLVLFAELVAATACYLDLRSKGVRPR